MTLTRSSPFIIIISAGIGVYSAKCHGCHWIYGFLPLKEDSNYLSNPQLLWLLSSVLLPPAFFFF